MGIHKITIEDESWREDDGYDRKRQSQLDDVIDDLIYQNYAANRDYTPEVEPRRWGRIYPNIEALEARYQAEKAILKAKVESEAT